MRLELYSERYSALGNISGEGLSRVLGMPSLDRHRVLVRETVQNSWDARAPGTKPAYSIWLRKMTGRQLEYLRTQILHELPDDGADAERLQRALAADSLRVLEIADSGTTGLGGPSRADVVSPQGEATDFVDFIRNIGSARDKEMGGGTYGYGKSSLYRASRCSTVLVHTLGVHERSPIERFIGCQLGHQFTRDYGPDPAHFTGRHWWGELHDDAGVEPAEGPDAAAIAQSLGLPQRGHGLKGTTCMILDPEMDGLDDRSFIAVLEEAILWNCWPKMLSAPSAAAQAMEFCLYLNEERIPIRSPKDFPPLNAFCKAMDELKSEGDKVMEIWVERPRRFLGRLSIVRAIRRHRVTKVAPQLSDMPEVSHHVALMRPAELVVKYLPGPRLESSAVEYGGVFIADPGVEDVYARSEPPAHDDWNPANLEKSEATLVRVGLRRIEEKTREFVGWKQSPKSEGGSEMRVSQLAADLGEMLVAVEGRRVGGGRPPSPRKAKKRSRSRNGTPWRVSSPAPAGHTVVAGRPCVRFALSVECADGHALELAAQALIIFEGAVSTKTVDGSRPEILGWTFGTRSVPDADRVALPPGFTGSVLVDVSIPGACALDLRIEAHPPMETVP